MAKGKKGSKKKSAKSSSNVFSMFEQQQIQENSNEDDYDNQLQRGENGENVTVTDQTSDAGKTNDLSFNLEDNKQRSKHYSPLNKNNDQMSFDDKLLDNKQGKT